MPFVGPPVPSLVGGDVYTIVLLQKRRYAQ